MNYNEARFKANANHDDGTVPWHNDPWGRPFKSNIEKLLREIAAFGCDRHVQGGSVCEHWCGQDKCAVALAEPESAEKDDAGGGKGAAHTDAEWVRRLRETAAHLRQNSLSLAKYPGMEDEARARELAALYIAEIAELHEAKRAIGLPRTEGEPTPPRGNDGGEHGR